MKNNILIIDCDLATCKEIKYNLSSDTIAAYYALSITERLKRLCVIPEDEKFQM